MRILSPARTWPRVKRLLLMAPVSLRAASPSFPVDCTNTRRSFINLTGVTMPAWVWSQDQVES